jgi:hypothetical protein
MKKWSKWRDR